LRPDGLYREALRKKAAFYQYALAMGTNDGGSAATDTQSRH